MPRKPRELKPGFGYHVTTRCNNREFKLLRHECREVFIYALNRAIAKYNFKVLILEKAHDFVKKKRKINS